MLNSSHVFRDAKSVASSFRFHSFLGKVLGSAGMKSEGKVETVESRNRKKERAKNSGCYGHKDRDEPALVSFMINR